MHQKLSHLNHWISEISDFSVEVVLVDDFTSDDSSREIENLVERHSKLNVKLIKGKFNSPGKARNAGLSKTTGAWVIFADSDDVLYVQPILSCLSNSDPSTIEVFQFRELDFQSSRVLKPLSDTTSEIDLVMGLGIWRMAFPATFLGKHKFTEIRMGEDLLYFLDVFESNSKIHFNSIHGYDYLIGSGTQLTADRRAVNELTLLLGELAHRVDTFKRVNILARLFFFKNTLSVAKHLGTRKSYGYAWQSFLMFLSSSFKDKQKFVRIIGRYCRS
jgi:glycosyltransferase involved in cell wall biosynthesis